jgi:hypothetical protein
MLIILPVKHVYLVSFQVQLMVNQFVMLLHRLMTTVFIRVRYQYWFMNMSKQMVLYIESGFAQIVIFQIRLML